MKQNEVQKNSIIKFRTKSLIVLLLLPLQLAGQEMWYRPVSEYRMLDWIDETAVELPEYEISDWRVEDLFNKFIHSEKSQGYYDPEGYILVKVRLTGELRTCSINSYIRRKVRAIMIRKAISLSRSAPIRRN